MTRNSATSAVCQRAAGALCASLLVLAGTAARADELARTAQALTATLTHGDAAVEVEAAALGLDAQRGLGGAVAGVRWNGARFTAECDALADALALIPAFEGDIDVGDDDEVTPIYPVPGEAVDCGALALALEQRLASGGEWTVEVPTAVREPRVSPAAIDALAADVQAMLAAPLSLDVTYRGEAAGSVTLTPDEVRAALHFVVADDPPRLVGRLEPEALRRALEPVTAPLGEPARDARFEIDAHDRVHVVAGRPGIRLDAAHLFGAAQDAAKKTDKKAAVAADKGEPSLSTKKAEALQIKGLVASFTTKHPCCQPRVTNIHRSATLLDGAVVDEGERFSLNRQIGKRTKKRGFVMAPSIGEGEFIDTVGGGVSQLATTLYNAVFDGGYAVVSRKPHTFYFNRYPLGVEATLSWPRPDFVFRNDSKSGVLIRTSFTEESVTVKLYGDNEGRKTKRFATKTFAPTDPRTDYEPDDTQPIDKPKVKDSGTQGFSVTAGRDIVFANGTKKHEERKVVYHGKPRVLLAHPCAIPKGEKGHQKKGCPKPEPTPVDDKDAAVTVAAAGTSSAKGTAAVTVATTATAAAATRAAAAPAPAADDTTTDAAPEESIAKKAASEALAAKKAAEAPADKKAKGKGADAGNASKAPAKDAKKAAGAKSKKKKKSADAKSP